MGEHKLPKAPFALPAGWEKHMRESRLPSARDNYANGPDGCVSSSTRMWAARYADDVEALLAEIDRLRTAERQRDELLAALRDAESALGMVWGQGYTRSLIAIKLRALLASIETGKEPT